MKLVSYVERPVQTERPEIKLGALIGDGGEDSCVVDLAVAQTWAQGARGFRARELPRSMPELLNEWANRAPHLQELVGLLPEGGECLSLKGAGRQPVARQRQDAILLPPLPNALSLRDFNGFEAHVRETHRRRGKDVPSAWYEAPVFTYGNPLTVFGADQGLSAPRQGSALDYELEIAVVISRAGRDIPPEDAADHIAGYMVMNDWSLRDVQLQEMGAGLGPAKGKDFATTVGPALVTPDELSDRQTGEGAELRYELEMVARVNGEERSRGNFRDIYWTVPQMIARASRDVTLLPGEIIGTGTVGTGCLLERGAQDSGEWLKPGDIVELEVERLGRLLTLIHEAEWD